MTTLSTIGGIAQIPFGHDDLGILSSVQPMKEQDTTSDASQSDTESIGLCVRLPQGTDFNYCDLIGKEAKLYLAKSASKLQVRQLWVNVAALDEIPLPELTQIVYRLPNYFDFSDEAKISYGIEICYRHITPENLALLKGLNFTRLRIHFGNCQELSEGNWISKVADNVDLLTNFDFRELSCSVHLDDFHRFDEIKQLILSLQLYNPQQIELLGQTSNADNPTISEKSRKFYLNLIESLTSKGFRAVSNQLFVTDGSSTAKLKQQGKLKFTPKGFSPDEIDHWLGLGLSAKGYMNDIKYQNNDILDDYAENLKKGQFPYSSQQKLIQIDPEIYQLIQYLMCTNDLDGHTIVDLHCPLRLQVESVISEACDNLWLESAGYHWRLTSNGMISVRDLYHRLIQCDPSLQINSLSTG
jgi:coproporphyrinogen III oxidase-like Fe-S oxidoreductase